MRDRRSSIAALQAGVRASALLPPSLRSVLSHVTLAVAAILCAVPLSAQLKEITINYLAKAPANWPLFVAKEGGYYQKYGLQCQTGLRRPSRGHCHARQR